MSQLSVAQDVADPDEVEQRGYSRVLVLRQMQANMVFLTPDELRQLTGYRRPALQRQWLEQAGIRHWVASTGRPVVAVEALGLAERPVAPTRPRLEVAR